MLCMAAVMAAFLFVGALPVFAAQNTQVKSGMIQVFAPAYRADDTKYPNFYGRLFIPSVGIDVALYNSWEQSTCDRRDSACIYPDLCENGTPFIADHNHQCFSVLKKVKPGDTAQVVTASGTIYSYQCVGVLDGHNTADGIPYDIKDENYQPVYGTADLICYT